MTLTQGKHLVIGDIFQVVGLTWEVTRIDAVGVIWCQRYRRFEKQITGGNEHYVSSDTEVTLIFDPDEVPL